MLRYFPRSDRFYFFFLLISLFSLNALPWISNWGLHWGFDFANLYNFHHCPLARSSPYLIPGADCGDLLNRDMIYPPVLYWFFAWTKFFSFEMGYFLWDLVIAAGVLGSLFFVWHQEKPPIPRGFRYDLLIWVLLFFQLPVIFALERGNNDILVVWGWLASLIFFHRKKYFLSGAWAGLCCCLKIYPVFGVLVLIAGIWKQKSILKNWLGGLIALGFLSLILFPQQTWIYVTQVLPAWSGQEVGRDPTIHSLRSMKIGDPWLPLSCGMSILFFWSRRAHQILLTDSDFIFGGTLALMTFFQNTSNDYNLVTTYPLLALCWLRSKKTMGRESATYSLFFFTGILFVIGYKFIWRTPYYNVSGLHVLFQVAWLIGLALLKERREVVP